MKIKNSYPCDKDNGVEIINTQGCNLKCNYCEPKTKGTLIDNSDKVIEWLEAEIKEERKINKIILTGGEPTIQKDLISFLKDLNELCSSIELRTNGTKPGVINKIITRNLITNIKMSIKAPLMFYSNVTKYKKNYKSNRRKNKWSCVYKSVLLIQRSNIDYKFRTVVSEGGFLKPINIKQIKNAVLDGDDNYEVKFKGNIKNKEDYLKHS